MKNYMLFAIAIIFLTNTISLAAWAKPCMMGKTTVISAEIEMTKASMDCHKKKQGQQKHCEGICLCEHATFSQTPIIENPFDFGPSPVSFEHILSYNESVTSLTTSPLRRPPRTNS